jgi:leucyl-tRNA synthetase
LSTEPVQFDAKALTDKWLPVWDQLKPFDSGKPEDKRPKKYVLDMFPYPSGDLHMGHAEAYALGDVIARYWIQKGFNVMHPIGWDSFGLPAENAAIKRGLDPRGWTYDNIAQQKASMRRYACSFDWDRVLITSDPEYYKWNQWLFLEFYNKGLAYRKNSNVNWCPSCQTVLANEQVVQGLCERCDTAVTKKALTQWYFKVTDYADRLLDDLDTLEGAWPAKVLTMQRNWIGRSYGAEVKFEIEARKNPIEVYTTRPDTLFGATFMVVAADSDLAAELASEAAPEVRIKFQDFLEETKKTNDIDRLATDRPKRGIDLGRFAINPVNGEKLPIWAADYVLADYGTGAIMAVPAHDQRDLDFARAMKLPVRVVVETGEEDPNETGIATTGDGKLVNSGALNGLTKNSLAIRRIPVPKVISVSPKSILSTVDPRSTISSARSVRSSKYSEISDSVGYGALSLYVARGADPIADEVLSQAVSQAARSFSEKEEPQLARRVSVSTTARTRESLEVAIAVFIEKPFTPITIYVFLKVYPEAISLLRV